MLNSLLQKAGLTKKNVNLSFFLPAFLQARIGEVFLRLHASKKNVLGIYRLFFAMPLGTASDVIVLVQYAFNLFAGVFCSSQKKKRFS